MNENQNENKLLEGMGEFYYSQMIKGNLDRIHILSIGGHSMTKSSGVGMKRWFWGQDL